MPPLSRTLGGLASWLFAGGAPSDEALADEPNDPLEIGSLADILGAMAELLKDSIGADVLATLANRLIAVDPGFDGNRLLGLGDDLDRLELKGRINLVADTIAADRPYLDTLTAVVATAAAATTIDANIDGGADGGGELGMWAAWPLCSVIERHGVDHPKESLAAMATLTKKFSCEFAIRPYLEHHPDLTWQFLERWVDDKDEAVRRLVSEGTRPNLPWGPRVAMLSEQPHRAIALLDHLRLDLSETVRRSVANHLNDVAKFNPDLVIATLDRWTNAEPAPEPSLVRHSLRTLVKSGNPDALRLLGLTINPDVAIEQFTCRPDTIALGQSLELGLTIRSTSKAAQRLVVDFVIHHVKANGGTSPKVFKWATVKLQPGETASLIKARPVRPISTRVYHPGRHRIDLQIAGRNMATTAFTLNLD